MADVSPSGHAGDGARRAAKRTSVAATTPLWVKAFAATALALVLVFAALHLTGRGLGGHRHHEAHPQGVAE
jgi:hypothetical protein